MTVFGWFKDIIPAFTGINTWNVSTVSGRNPDEIQTGCFSTRQEHCRHAKLLYLTLAF
jgi:hypothetical protein